MLKLVVHIVNMSIFLSSSGLWIGKHYCKEQQSYVHTSLNQCCEDHNEKSCDFNSYGDEHDEDEHKSCCHTDYKYYKLDQDQQLQLLEVEDYRTFNIYPIPTFVRTSKTSFHHFYTKEYQSPFIFFDCQVDFQRFLC